MEFLLALSRALLIAIENDDPLMTHLCARSFLMMNEQYFPE
jgi:hypothetical protein